MNNFWQTIKKPIVGLSPMDGVTDEPMRQIQVKIAKPDVMYTEFISVEGFLKRPEKLKEKIFFQENERPIVAQVFGYTPQAFSEVIKELCNQNFDGIDINMGCPAKSILEKGGGAALIGNFNLAEKILSNSLKTLKSLKKPVPLSIKTRIAKTPEDSKNWFSFLSKFPLSEITIHGRPISQGNSSPVNWEEISLAAKIIKSKGIICLGNGGIKSIKEAKEKCQKYNLDGVLIGQAALGNPWIFKEQTPEKEEILKTIYSHAKLAWQSYGEKGFTKILKHFSWYPRGFKGSKKLKVALLKTRNLEEVEKILKNCKNYDEASTSTIV